MNFENAYSKAKQMQNCGIINYGPFVINGTNCSRFVRSVLLSAEISLLLQFKIRFTRTLSPTPIGVVNNLNQQRKANFRKRYFSVEKSVKECEIITS
ncbi:DUF6695 family protein [Flavobacterium sp. CS20]|uniref:DUF6695 family protein n=1 Tax=Flavobacterium sp. CS20 TaxID=2775246 RepID=UPI003530382A